VVKNCGEKGVTLVETIVVFVIIGIISIGIMRLVRYAYDSWWLASSKLDAQKNAQDLMYWISTDFKRASRSTIGNVVQNPGFEKPSGVYTSIDNWSGLPAGVYKVDSNDNTRSGFYAVKLINAVNYDSQLSAYAYDGNYILSCWIYNSAAANPGGTARCEIVGTGISVSTQTFSTPSWVHLATLTGNQVAGTNFTVRLRNLTANTTVYFDNVSVSPQSVSFNKSLASDAYYPYEVSEAIYASAGKVGKHRLHFIPSSSRISREWYDGAGYVDIGPLCTNVDSLVINNIKQDYFDVTLQSVYNISGLAGLTTYYLNTKIYPATP
jgi:type II secretory pathway pseudopilin PulG